MSRDSLRANSIAVYRPVEYEPKPPAEYPPDLIKSGVRGKYANGYGRNVRTYCRASVELVAANRVLGKAAMDVRRERIAAQRLALHEGVEHEVVLAADGGSPFARESPLVLGRGEQPALDELAPVGVGRERARVGCARHEFVEPRPPPIPGSTETAAPRSRDRSRGRPRHRATAAVGVAARAVPPARRSLSCVWWRACVYSSPPRMVGHLPIHLGFVRHPSNLPAG